MAGIAAGLPRAHGLRAALRRAAWRRHASASASASASGSAPFRLEVRQTRKLEVDLRVVAFPRGATGVKAWTRPLPDPACPDPGASGAAAASELLDEAIAAGGTLLLAVPLSSLGASAAEQALALASPESLRAHARTLPQLAQEAPTGRGGRDAAGDERPSVEDGARLGRAPAADAAGRPRGAEKELLAAAKAGDLERIRRLAATGCDLHARDPASGATALHFAAVARAPRAEAEAAPGTTIGALTVRALLRAGADPNGRARNGSTALHWAAGARQPEVRSRTQAPGRPARFGAAVPPLPPAHGRPRSARLAQPCAHNSRCPARAPWMGRRWRSCCEPPQTRRFAHTPGARACAAAAAGRPLCTGRPTRAAWRRCGCCWTPRSSEGQSSMTVGAAPQRLQKRRWRPAGC